MQFKSLFSSAALLLAGLAQAQSTAYTDDNTGITFQSWTDPKSNFTFGIALPENPTTDFIGQFSAPITEGYASLSLGSSMAKKILIVAWPNGEKVVSSLRKATGYTNPDVLDDSTVVIKPIEKGTTVGASSFTFTFLCEGCIKDDGSSFTASDDPGILGFAVSSTALTTPSDASGALNYHDAGFGGFSLDLAAAQSSKFSTWSAMASDDTSGSDPSTGGGSTGNFTTIVSNATYDYIVAGAGAAGLIVAERLAETKKSVLLLERGKASYFSSGGRSVMEWNDTVTQYDVPGMGYYLTTAADTSEYCTDTASMAGCVLGGSTAINAMMFVKPQSIDFDDKWPTGWKWEDVQASAEKLYERTPGTTTPSKDKKLYDQGAWNVLSKWLSGNNFVEVDGIEEPDKKRSVFTHTPTMINDGLRSGPVRDYLPLAQALSNFKLQLNTKVLRVIRTGSTVTGVEVETGPTTRQIINLKSNGAVILASGALSTPRVLINSGIGPSDQIATVSNGTTRITLPAKDDWINLPVGKHLMDHPIFTVSLKTKQSLSALPSTDFTDPSQTDVDLFAQGSGLMAQSGQRLIFWTSVKSADGVERFVQGTCNAPSNDTIKMKVYLTHGATSTGSLGMTSAGATKFISEPYLKTDGDKEAITTFMKQVIGYASKPNSTLTIASNATAESLISDYTTGSHYVGTAKMGAENDGNSVVDVDTKVWGTENLFVVDASIHPDLPTGNTQAIVMVAAEHAAAKIINRGGSVDITPTTPTNGTASPGTISGTPSSVATASSAATSSAATKAPTACRSRRSRRGLRHRH
ncbi:cellobiose dehydrogenase [Fusarium albosuccineum]|uniref:Cellobiose dehydrogenase n=1 Tax=Fusarium albosuccineum TaxID=1237068 RepID=A0A8H4KUD4_9HYPO|nr:cellobiose dehydrogenase [Fusarium albosuccineum]